MIPGSYRCGYQCYKEIYVRIGQITLSGVLGLLQARVYSMFSSPPVTGE